MSEGSECRREVCLTTHHALSQAILAFIENGVLVTLLPLSLKPYQHSEVLISVTNKGTDGWWRWLLLVVVVGGGSWWWRR